MAMIKLSGKSADVQDIIGLQLINQLSGLETWTLRERMTAPNAVFLCVAFAHTSMVGRMGEPKGSPGFSCDRFSSPVRSTTSNRIASHISNVINSLQVLNTPITSGGYRTRQSCGFFVSPTYVGWRVVHKTPERERLQAGIVGSACGYILCSSTRLPTEHRDLSVQAEKHHD